MNDDFRIYFWPIFVFYLFGTFMLLLFLPLEPGSQKELVFVITGASLCVGCLWVLLLRYRKIKSKMPGKRVLILLVIVTVITFIGVTWGVVRIVPGLGGS